MSIHSTKFLSKIFNLPFNENLKLTFSKSSPPLRKLHHNFPSFHFFLPYEETSTNFLSKKTMAAVHTISTPPKPTTFAETSKTFPRNPNFKNAAKFSNFLFSGHTRRLFDFKSTFFSAGQSFRLKSSNRPRGPLWKSRNLSREAMEVVQELVWSKGDEIKEDEILQNKGARLLKADIIAVLYELERQNNWKLCLKVLDHIRKEVWYYPDPNTYARLISCLGKAQQQEIAHSLFDQMIAEGCAADTTAYMAIIGAYCRGNCAQQALQLYERMKAERVLPSEPTYRFLIQTCTNAKLAAVERLVKERDFLYPEGEESKGRIQRRRG